MDRDRAPSRLVPQLVDLAEAMRELSTVTSLDDVLEIAATRVCRGLAASTVSLSRLEPGTGMLRTLINVGDLGPNEERWPRNETYSAEQFLQMRAVIEWARPWSLRADDATADPSELDLLRELGKQAALASPLIVEGRVWGELYVTYADADDLLSADDEQWLHVQLALVESALARVLTVERYKAMAFHDPLTGLPNRRALDDAAAQAFAAHADSGLTVSVAAIDLNGLKQLNDRLGHAEGDRYICAAATEIERGFRPLHGSLSARVGGDEFVTLVAGHDLDGVVACAEQVCDAIEGLSLGHGASCGVASSPVSEVSSPSRLFALADAALYRSKTTRRIIVTELEVDAKSA